MLLKLLKYKEKPNVFSKYYTFYLVLAMKNKIKYHIK